MRSLVARACTVAGKSEGMLFLEYNRLAAGIPVCSIVDLNKFVLICDNYFSKICLIKLYLSFGTSW